MTRRLDQMRDSLARTPSPQNAKGGKTNAAHTPLQVSSQSGPVAPRLRTWMQERAGRQLGKYATQIERVSVRFSDENGTKGGVDQRCTIQVALSALSPLIVHGVATTMHDAFNDAMAKAQRAARRTLRANDFRVGRPPEQDAEADAGPPEDAPRGNGGRTVSEDVPPGSLIGARVGQGRQNVLDAQQFHDDVDTSRPGTSASDQRPGGLHTAPRNAKLNLAGLAYRLEDSTSDRASRRSTRKSLHHEKPDTNLTRRTRSKLNSAQARAARADRQRMP